MAQVKGLPDRPLLSVRDREGTYRYGHAEGTAGEGRRWLVSGSDGHKLNRRVRTVRDDHLPRRQAAEGCAAGGVQTGRAQLLVLEWKLALPARRDRNGPVFKERQSGLAGIGQGHQVPLRGGRELPADQERMPAAQ